MRNIVTLCGSSRFGSAFEQALFDETLKGHMVFTIGTTKCSDVVLLTDGILTLRQIQDMALVHIDKISASDEILVLNVDDYIGQTTKEEIDFARSIGVKVRWLVSPSMHAQAGEMYE